MPPCPFAWSWRVNASTIERTFGPPSTAAKRVLVMSGTAVIYHPHRGVLCPRGHFLVTGEDDAVRHILAGHVTCEQCQREDEEAAALTQPATASTQATRT